MKDRKRHAWEEDDATCHGDPDHETWSKAYLRLTGEVYRKEDEASRTDGGDGDTVVMKNGWTIWASYPGGSHIDSPEQPSAVAAE